jgi:beta-glucanase (GH16 family)
MGIPPQPGALFHTIMERMKHPGWSVLIIAIFLCGCAAQAAPAPTATASPIPSATLIPSLTLTPTISTTPTLTPTNTRTMTKTPTLTPTPGPPRASMQLIFQDEFEGSQMDPAKWIPCYPWDNDGCTNSGNNEEEWYIPQNVLVENGLLRLRALQQPVKGSDGKNYPYTSGMVTSFKKFFTTYGYFEMRAKMPMGKGMWPAFWLLPENEEWPPEIDILEVLGHDPHTLYTTLHFKTKEIPHLGNGGTIPTIPDLSADYHIYAVDWLPDHIAWYFDGAEVFRVTENIPAQPMYVIANLAVGGNWPGSPNEDTAFPNYFDIDYIRVYRDPALPTPTPTP